MRTLSRLFGEGGENKLVSIYSLSMINPHAHAQQGSLFVLYIVCVSVYLLCSKAFLRWHLLPNVLVIFLFQSSSNWLLISGHSTLSACFPPPHATSWPKSDTNEFTLHWLDLGCRISRCLKCYLLLTPVKSLQKTVNQRWSAYPSPSIAMGAMHMYSRVSAEGLHYNAFR